MLTAMFISCIASVVTGSQHCTVSYTEMETLANNKTECLIVARRMQNTVAEDLLRTHPIIEYKRKEVKCGTRVEMLTQVISEFKSISARGIPVEEFEF